MQDQPQQLQPGVSTWLGPGLRRVMADNPSAFTGPGTNSYLLGEGEVTLIDPGPDDPRHLAALLAALAPGERITRILVTHSHLDHSGLAPALAAATGAPVLAFGTSRDGVNPDLAALGPMGGGEGIDPRFSPDRRLVDGEVLALASGDLQVIHTPGHLGNHLAFLWRGVLFSGDHVMGWSTSIVSPPEGDMGAYMRALDRLAALPLGLVLPGHGAPIADGLSRIAELAAHRRLRESQILAALAQAPGSAEALAGRIYTDLAPGLLPAATRNVLAHLLDLQERKEISADRAQPREAIWKISSQK